MKMFSLVLVLMIGTAMAVVEENAVEEWGSRSPPGNCHCEQTQAGGIHGHSSASFCDQDCPGGPFCSQARVPPPLLPSCDYPLAYPPSAPLLLPPPTCSHLLHTCVTCMFFINQRTPPHTLPTLGMLLGAQFHCGGTRANPSLHGCAWLCAPPPPSPSPPPPPRRVISAPRVEVHHVVTPDPWSGWGAPAWNVPAPSFTHPDLHSFSGSAWNFLMGEPSAAQVGGAGPCLPSSTGPACRPWGALPAVLGAFASVPAHT